MNDALRKAIESTAKDPKEAAYLSAILRQVDIQRFEHAAKPPIATPVNLFEKEDLELLVNEQEWEDIEFEVALDSGSIINVCHPDDCPGYAITESAGSKVGQHVVVGDGGRLKNLGEWNLNLKAPNDKGVN